MLTETSRKGVKPSIAGSRNLLAAALIAAVVLLAILVAVSELDIELPQYSGKVM